MRAVERFKNVAKLLFYRPAREPSPYDLPGVHGGDARFIRAEHIRRKFGGRVFYGDGAADAEARRAAELNPKPPERKTPEGAPNSHTPKKKGRRLSKAERLAAKIEKLKAEIEALE